MNPDQKSLKELLLERLEGKNLNVEKIFQATEIPKHYLESMMRGDWKKLPAAPYTRGYFKKLAGLLDWSDGEMWLLYQNEVDTLKVSGATDRLPENRFAIKRKARAWTWPVIAVVLLLGYAGFNLDRLLGKPQLNVTSPLSASLVTSLSNFTIQGETNAQDKLFINNEEVFVDKKGDFEKNYNLQPGLNTFEITAKRFLGRETKVVKQIIYQSPNDQSQKGK